MLDGVDGNIARFNNQCSKNGELWDAFVGWVAMIAFYVGMGFTAFYQKSLLHFPIDVPDSFYIFFGDMAAMSCIFPRLVMQKKMNLSGKESVGLVQNRGNYGIAKLLVFNLTSINGLAAIVFLVSYLLGITKECTLFYFILNSIISLGSLWNLMKK